MATVNSRSLKKIRMLQLLASTASQEDAGPAAWMRGYVRGLVQHLMPRLRHIAAPLPLFNNGECPAPCPVNPKIRGLSLLRLRDIHSHHQLFLTEDGSFLVGEKCEEVKASPHFHPFLGAIREGQLAPSEFTWERATLGEVIFAIRQRYREACDRRKKILDSLERDNTTLWHVDESFDGTRWHNSWLQEHHPQLTLGRIE